jgi:ABC-2 type transport system ATP-binding protein
VQPYLTVAEVIDLYRGYYPLPLDRDEVIRIVGLEEKADVRVNKLSGGQKRRLDVGVGLAGNPELLFLDEPTTGFDPSARRNAWGMIKQLSALGKTVVLTTHYMDEAQNLADHAAIMVAGKIVAEGPPRVLAASTTQGTRISFRLGPRDPVPPQKIIKGASVKRRAYAIESRTPVRTLHDLTAWALRRNVELKELSVSHPSLEDIYLSLTKDAQIQP